MVDETFIKQLPLSSLPIKTRKLLSCRLNSQKIILSDGPDKLPRDWRGLASRANISSELESYIKQCSDKTAKVLEIWLQYNRAATVGELLSHLEYIDRFDVSDDVCDDLKEALRSGELSTSRPNQIAIPNNQNGYNSAVSDSEQITYDDRPGYAHIYDALVLYADEDKPFVDDMLRRMGDEGYQICTVDDLHVGHSTQYAPVAELISNRCRRVILVFSPEFLNSKGMSFYINFAQADSIESKERKIIPIMYRTCQLPSNLSYYHKLFYQSNGRSMYDFWDKLRLSLAAARMAQIHPAQQRQHRLNGSLSQSSPPQIRIEEYPSDPLPDYEDSLFLPRSIGNISMNSLNSLKISAEDRKSLSSVSQGSVGSESKKKKKNPFKKLFNFKGKKKTPIMVAD